MLKIFLWLFLQTKPGWWQGALCVLTMGLALAMVPVVMFPILKKHNEALALGYVVLRGGLEAVGYVIITISWLILASLNQIFAGALDAASFQALGTLLLEDNPIRPRFYNSLQSRRSAILLPVVSNKARASVVVGVGSHRTHTVRSYRGIFGYVRCPRASVAPLYYSANSVSFTGDGVSGMADCQRIQFICNRFRNCQK